MVCIQCSAKTQVINSRPQKRRNQTWRRRQCSACHTIFSTIETTDYSAVWAVKQASGAIMAFNRDKLLLSIYQSCQHRPNALIDASDLTDTSIYKLRTVASNGQLSAKQIARTVQVALNRFDKVASVHYQAFHKN